MKAGVAALFASAALGGLILGWRMPQPGVAQALPLRPRAASLAARAPMPEQTADALSGLAPYLVRPDAPASSGGDPDRPPPASATPGGDPTPPPAPAPPPVDVGKLFRGRLSAVVDVAAGTPTAVLVEAGGDGPQSRRLRVGEVFLDQWRLASLTTSEAVLRKGREERRVSLFANPDAE